jgi:predicted transcriptional regulator
VIPGPGVPYVVGQWVRGEKFYGRDDLIAEILDGPRNSIWLLGTRRIGKTSLLKQLEHITSTGDHGFLPVFWDFQGADDPGELGLTFSDALLDAEDRLGDLGIALTEIENEDLFSTMGVLRRRLRARGLSLLLLCDEVEELIGLHRKDPALLRKLRRAMQSQEGVRSVLASSVRLCALAEQRGDTSPFLHGFSPPLYIAGLSQGEAESLIRQDRLDAGSRPRFSTEDVELIRSRCGNHPYLIQLVCKRFLELEDLDEACEQVAADRMVNYFFSVDFEMLSDTEQTVLRILSERAPAAAASIAQALVTDSGARTGALQRLENLGFIQRHTDRRYTQSGFFLKRWLDDLAIARPPEPPSGGRGTAPPHGEDTTLSLRTVDGRYTLQHEIGAGAAGTVYKAWDSLLQTQVALKLLRPECTANPDALERVRQEILLSRDIGHPNILRIYHLGAFEGRTYLTMQWIKGATLAELITDRAPLPLETVLGVSSKLASALAAAHGRAILHRDIKPSNILLGDDGEPYLADFGLARLIGEHGITSHGLFVGTPHYASPEQVALEPLDERSDLYSFGVVLFEMATGRRPFAAATVQEMLDMQRSAPPPDPRSITPSVPAALAELILRCLEKEPADRFPDAVALEGALHQIARDS